VDLDKFQSNAFSPDIPSKLKLRNLDKAYKKEVRCGFLFVCVASRVCARGPPLIRVSFFR